MKQSTAISLKLGSAVIASLLLMARLTAAPPQEPPSPQRGGNRATPSTKYDHGHPFQPRYEFQSIDVDGGLWTAVYGINSSGLALAEYIDGDWGTGNSDSFLWRNGRRTQIVHQGNPIVDMEKINNRGLVSGGVGFADIEHAALFNSDTGAWTLLPDIEGKPLNFCMKINDVGIAVGQACEGNYWNQGNCVNWKWDGKAYSSNAIPSGGTPAQYTGPISINDRGQMVGQYLDADGHVHSYLQEGAKVTSLDVSGATDTYINDINNLGEVVVDANFGPWPGPNQNYIWRKGRLTPLPNVPVPDAIGTYTHSINDRGDYSGAWIDADGEYHGFVAVRTLTLE